LPQREASARWLERNYDVVYFGFICPHQTKAYSTPEFLPIYDVQLPKVSGITDGYWEEYADWGSLCLAKVKAAVVVQPTYADVVRKATGFKNLHVLLAPFCPQLGRTVPRATVPLLIWPNQWKNIKGVTQVVDCIPSLPDEVQVELYSNGIRYYQMRTEDRWKNAVGEDKFMGFNGIGRATFFGNVDMPEIYRAYQRAWFTVNLQGMSSRKEAYKRGSYNLTEVEALWYGCLPILHTSTLQTALPQEVYRAVSSADEIPDTIVSCLADGYVLDPTRQRRARDYVIDNHLASNHYRKLKEIF
jgi:hypothetical protein